MKILASNTTQSTRRNVYAFIGFIALLFIFILSGIARDRCGKKNDKTRHKQICRNTSTRMLNQENAENNLRPFSDNHILVQSTDNGMTWGDISHQMPDTKGISHFFANEKEIFVSTFEGIIYYCQDIENPEWTREYVGPYLKNEMINGIFGGNYGPYVSIFGRGLFQKVPATGFWQPIGSEQMNDLIINDVCELPDGSILVASAGGLYKSDRSHQHWKHVYTTGWVSHIACSKQGLIASALPGLLTSVDGDKWTCSLADEAAVYNCWSADGKLTVLRERIPFHQDEENAEVVRQHLLNRFKESVDGGKTWQSVNLSLNDLNTIHSVSVEGNTLLVSHKKGISRSNDGGRSWQTVYTIPQNSTIQQIKLIKTTGVLYALMSKGGC